MKKKVVIYQTPVKGNTFQWNKIILNVEKENRYSCLYTWKKKFV